MISTQRNRFLNLVNLNRNWIVNTLSDWLDIWFFFVQNQSEKVWYTLYNQITTSFKNQNLYVCVQKSSLRCLILMCIMNSIGFTVSWTHYKLFIITYETKNTETEIIGLLIERQSLTATNRWQNKFYSDQAS